MKDTDLTEKKKKSTFFHVPTFRTWLSLQMVSPQFRKSTGEQAMELWADATDGGPIIDCEVRSLQHLGGTYET